MGRTAIELTAEQIEHGKKLFSEGFTHFRVASDLGVSSDWLRLFRSRPDTPFPPVKKRPKDNDQ